MRSCSLIQLMKYKNRRRTFCASAEKEFYELFLNDSRHTTEYFIPSPSTYYHTIGVPRLYEAHLSTEEQSYLQLLNSKDGKIA